ncbi:hypothetical protein HXX76_004296 [Chlamydomonas incerta]|uniref:Uncharacterized protein n=1 Tax=Chlamydomonas incerta TaxID=51695 RepID=A0A835T7K5_CHLIN|nr:hypothetical protein HXX76_004296 [Chlamydomonas incerta]|eukprot:KAG2440183.1 hypothetical protein HXX76_004296 [Chlamydomonas incerta]
MIDSARSTSPAAAACPGCPAARAHPRVHPPLVAGRTGDAAAAAGGAAALQSTTAVAAAAAAGYVQRSRGSDADDPGAALLRPAATSASTAARLLLAPARSRDPAATPAGAFLGDQLVAAAGVSRVTPAPPTSLRPAR